MSRFDAIVIGGGHNGLVAAATLAQAGKTVCVLERAPMLGGMAADSDWVEGVRGPRLAHLLYNLSPLVSSELGLDDPESSFRTLTLPTICLDPEDKHLILDGSDVRFANGEPHPDAQAYAHLTERLSQFAELLRGLAEAPPPGLNGAPLSVANLKQLLRLGRLGWSLKRLPKPEMREFLRIVLSNAFDLVLDELPDGPLAGQLAADAIRGANAGPRAPGTVFSLMYRMGHGGSVSLPMGGMDSVVKGFGAAARIAGCQIRTDAAVQRILLEEDAVCGVELSDGQRLRAPLVLTSTGPLAACQMAGPQHFDIETTRRLRSLRAKGTAAKINLVLRDVPQFTGLTEAQSAGRLLIAPSATYVERAFNPSKYGDMSDNPVIEAVTPSLSDPALVSDGRHIMSVVMQYAPYTLNGGWTQAAKDKLQRITVDALARHAPGLPDLIVQSEALPPTEIEALTGAPGGHWHHAEMSFDQLLTIRPVNGMGQYAMGPTGMYLCGASGHPGGDVMGLAGRNAALQALQDEARRA